MKKFFFVLILVLIFTSGLEAQEAQGCNFGVTNTLIVGPSHSYTISQGNWGKRRYIWKWGDGSKADSTYTNNADQTFGSHTYSLNGAYSFTVIAQDSATGAGCVVMGIFNIQVTGAAITVISEELESESYLRMNNPFSSSLFLQTNSPHSLLLMDSGGKIVKEFQVTEYSNSINTEDLPAGIYLLRDQEGKVRRKLYKTCN